MSDDWTSLSEQSAADAQVYLLTIREIASGNSPEATLPMALLALSPAFVSAVATGASFVPVIVTVAATSITSSASSTQGQRERFGRTGGGGGGRRAGGGAAGNSQRQRRGRHGALAGAKDRRPADARGAPVEPAGL